MAVMRGLRCAIEGKVADTQNAESVVVADAKNVWIRVSLI
jgi:hypothetical protein